jgi:hypothetical protein
LPESIDDRQTRAEALLAARAEQVRRIESELAAALDAAARLRGELDLAGARLRWTEALAEDRRRLLQFEQQRRVRLEHEIDALTREFPGETGAALAARIAALVPELEAARAHAAAIETSTIWRATLPLRRSVAILRRALAGR